MKFSELEQVSSQLSCCKEGSCIFFATTCFCSLTVLLIFMLPERGHPVARAKEIATVSLRVFRHPAVCACGSLSGFFCVPVRWARCLDRFSAGYALWSICTCCACEVSFSCVCAMGALRFALAWWSASFLAPFISFPSMIHRPWERERQRKGERSRGKA